MWKSQQHRLTSQYDILSSLLSLVKHYFVIMEEDDNQFKTTCQSCNGFVTRSGRIGELLCITFLHHGLCTIGPYPEELDP